MTNADLIEEAYAEKAAREEHQERQEQTGEKGPGDLSAPSTAVATPTLHRNKVPVGERFESGDIRYGSGTAESFNAGDMVRGDLDATNAESADATGGAKRYRANPRVANDLVGEGHGFKTQRFSNPDKPSTCRYCGTNLLTPNELSPCEFETPTHPTPIMAPDIPVVAAEDGSRVDGSRVRRMPNGRLDVGGVNVRQIGDRRKLPILVARNELDGSLFAVDGQRGADNPSRPGPSEHCQCNGCRIRIEGVRKRGGQPKVCEAVECQRKANTDKTAKKRERKLREEREKAKIWVAAYPHESDKTLAEWAMVRPIRVKEARKALA